MRNGYAMIYAGEERWYQRGVAIMMSQDTQKSLIEWTAVSSRIITAQLYSRFKNTTDIQAYAPTNESTGDDREKDDFYDQLQAGRVGLRLNAQKCKVMRMNTRRGDKVMIGREEVEVVEEFVYMDATVTKEGGGTGDIKKRLSKAQGAFFNFWIWNTRSIGLNTKFKLFKTLVRPVLLYGCEAWKLTAAEENKLERFQFTCLRRILRIRWPQRIRNDTTSQVTGVNKISDEIRRRRWYWIGHVLKKVRNDDCNKWDDLKPHGEGRWKKNPTSYTITKGCRVFQQLSWKFGI